MIDRRGFLEVFGGFLVVVAVNVVTRYPIEVLFRQSSC